MRVVVDSESSRDLGQNELRRHLQMMSRFIERAEAGATLHMILRSPEADPAKALIGMTGALQGKGVRAKVILAKIEPDDELKKLFDALSALQPREPAPELIRWARNPRLAEAHEQVTFGTTMCWSGDAMRRDADRRNALTVFQEQAPEAVRLGRLAFEALWTACALVPTGRLTGQERSRPSGAYEPGAEPPASVSPHHPGPQGWPLIRH
jgi:hypothetical protein